MKYIILTLIWFVSYSQITAQPGTVSQEEVSIQKIFLEGKVQMIRGNMEEALTIFKEVLEKDRDNAAAAYEMARIYDSNEDNDNAIKYAQKATEWEKDNAWYHILLAEFYQKTSQDDKAAMVYENMTKIFPTENEYYFQWAYFLVRSSQPEAAIKVYKMLEDKIGVNEELTRRKHSLYLGLGNYKKAEKELLVFIEKYPTSTSALHNLANFYEQTGEQNKAQATYKKIIQIDPKDSQAIVALAQNDKKSSGEIGYLAKLKPVFQNPNIHIDVKITELFPIVTKVADTGDKNLAVQALELAYILEEVHPNQAKAFSVTGDLLYYSEKNEAAIERYQKTLDLNDNVYAVWEQMLYIYAELKDYDNLVKESENALDLFPNQGAIYYLNGLGYSGQEKHRDAVSALQQALIMSNKNPRLKFQIHTLLGGEYGELNQGERSNKNFEEALKLNPSDPLVLNNYAFYLAERNEELAKAKDMAAKANELLPERAIFHST